jgi:uncharacterized membrane protein YkvI
MVVHPQLAIVLPLSAILIIMLMLVAHFQTRREILMKLKLLIIPVLIILTLGVLGIEVRVLGLTGGLRIIHIKLVRMWPKLEI